MEDLVSTGGSVLKVVQALRAAEARVSHCLCLFTYGFPETEGRFADQGCTLHPLLTLEDFLAHLEATGRLGPEHRALLDDWRRDPFGWAARRKEGRE